MLPDPLIVEPKRVLKATIKNFNGVFIKGKDGEKGETGLTGEKGEKGDRGEKGTIGDKGKDGKDGRDGVDGLNGVDGRDGKDGSPDTAEQIADKLNTLEERVDLKVLKGWKEFLANLGEKGSATRVYGSRMLRNLVDVIGAKDATTGQVLTKQSDGTFAFEDAVAGGGIGNSFETVSKNLDASGATLAYTGDNLTSITYASGVVKTLSYTGDNLTSVVLSGGTPSGINLTKTLSYTGDNLTGVAYS